MSEFTYNKPDYMKLKHDVVVQRFEGDLRFVNYMNIGKRGDLVAAVYHARKPNREKGHKEYMMLYEDPRDERMYVTGMELEDVKKLSVRTGMACLSCKKALVSLYRHDMNSCGCDNDLFVDGGRDYVRCGAKDLSQAVAVRVDLLTDEVVVDPSAPLE